MSGLGVMPGHWRTREPAPYGEPVILPPAQLDVSPYYPVAFPSGRRSSKTCTCLVGTMTHYTSHMTIRR